jgi:CRP-like cAMP-binding protein
MDIVAGTKMFKEGDSCKGAYLIVEGSCSIYLNRNPNLLNKEEYRQVTTGQLPVFKMTSSLP